jgi:hypothetical protein
MNQKEILIIINVSFLYAEEASPDRNASLIDSNPDMVCLGKNTQELTVLLPCLEEAETISKCISKEMQFHKKTKLVY